MIEIAGEMQFGRALQDSPRSEAGRLLGGWANPEDGFTWSIGDESRFALTLSPRDGAGEADATFLELELNPFALPGSLTGQDLTVLVNGTIVGHERIVGQGTVGYVLPNEVLSTAGELTITLRHPEARSPTELGFNADDRTLGFMLFRASVLRAPSLPAVSRRGTPLPPLDLPASTETETLKTALHRLTGLAAETLVEGFESIGHNCEFGMVQRHCGIEPLGLFRFAGVTLPDLLKGLDTGFEGLGRPDEIEVSIDEGQRREFLVRDRRHNISIHTLRFEDETTADIVKREQSGQMRFFHRKFMEDLETGERLFVFQRPGQTTISQALPLLTRLRSYGPNALLYVTDDRSKPPGTVEQVGYGLFRGSTDYFAPEKDVGDCHLSAWLSLCLNARRLWSAQQAETA